jgi:hydrogenase nickel incorporation protein HypA/HybF
MLRCHACGHEFPMDRQEFVCPACGSQKIAVAGGEEFYLESIDVDLAPDAQHEQG